MDDIASKTRTIKKQYSWYPTAHYKSRNFGFVSFNRG